MSDHRISRFEDTTVGRVMKMWPVIVAILIFAFNVGISSSTVTRLEKAQDEVAQQNSDQERRIVRLEQIADEIPTIKADIKEILRRLPR